MIVAVFGIAAGTEDVGDEAIGSANGPGAGFVSDGFRGSIAAAGSEDTELGPWPPAACG